MNPRRGLASGHNAGAPPAARHAHAGATRGQAVGYGDDPWTRSLTPLVRRHFGAGAEVFPVFNGTAANVLCLKALAKSHHAVICTEMSHIQVDECGAPEAWTGCKLVPLATPDGKL